LPEGLREIIAIHTLNAGVAPQRTPALYASMPAVMAKDGIWVPEGGVYEIVRSLAKLARSSGVDLRIGEPVYRIEPRRVFSTEGTYEAEAVVSGIDADRLEGILDPGKKITSKRLSCSGIALYAALPQGLPAELATHSVVLPSNPAALYENLEAGHEPEEAMAFVDYYRPGEGYPNDENVLALGLTVPANGREYALGDEFVAREIERVSRVIGLPRPFTEYFGECKILHPRYFGAWGSAGGALYGAVRPFWMSGPLHRPKYTEHRRPWLWRVGSSVHPGGGIPAVLGGAMISTSRLLRFLGNNDRQSAPKRGEGNGGS
jgi:phytoene dehydrogenase-like protein